MWYAELVGMMAEMGRRSLDSRLKKKLLGQRIQRTLEPGLGLLSD